MFMRLSVHIYSFPRLLHNFDHSSYYLELEINVTTLVLLIEHLTPSVMRLI